VLDFVRDVRPLYVECNLVIVPTTVSAGTNLKVLEAMAMERAVVSTTCGCAGLGLEHGANVWIADDADSFAKAVARLLANPPERARLARAAKSIVVQFDWKQLGRKQRALYREILRSPRTT
jgi:glycosyltransferase involved in cell wall biosynthesis